MIYQKPIKTITSAYTTTDADNGYRIVCDSASDFAVTLHSATGRYNFDIELDNIGAGDVTCGDQTIAQNTHAHIGCDGTSWVIVIGGGGSLGGGASGSFDYGSIADTTTTTQDWGSIA